MKKCYVVGKYFLINITESTNIFSIRVFRIRIVTWRFLNQKLLRWMIFEIEKKINK